jgi:hypothetical protein
VTAGSSCAAGGHAAVCGSEAPAGAGGADSAVRSPAAGRVCAWRPFIPLKGLRDVCARLPRGASLITMPGNHGHDPCVEPADRGSPAGSPWRRLPPTTGQHLPDGSCATSSLTSPARFAACARAGRRNGRSGTQRHTRVPAAPAGCVAFSGAHGRGSDHGTHRRRGEGHFRCEAPGLPQLIMGYRARDIGGGTGAGNGVLIRRFDARRTKTCTECGANEVLKISAQKRSLRDLSISETSCLPLAVTYFPAGAVSSAPRA